MIIVMIVGTMLYLGIRVFIAWLKDLRHGVAKRTILPVFKETVKAKNIAFTESHMKKRMEKYGVAVQELILIDEIDCEQKDGVFIHQMKHKHPNKNQFEYGGAYDKYYDMCHIIECLSFKSNK